MIPRSGPDARFAEASAGTIPAMQQRVRSSDAQPHAWTCLHESPHSDGYLQMGRWVRRLAIVTAVALTFIAAHCTFAPPVSLSESNPSRADWDAFIDAAVEDPAHAAELVKKDPALLVARGLWGETPLHFLAVEGYTDAVRFLIKLGANPDLRNQFGDAPLQNCVSIHKPDHDLYEIIAAMLSAGADPYYRVPNMPCAYCQGRCSGDPRVRQLFASRPAPTNGPHEDCPVP